MSEYERLERLKVEADRWIAGVTTNGSLSGAASRGIRELIDKAAASAPSAVATSIEAEILAQWVEKCADAPTDSKARVAASIRELGQWDVRAWWKAVQETGGPVAHEDGWVLSSRSASRMTGEPGGGFSIYKGLCQYPQDCRLAGKCLGVCEKIDRPEQRKDSNG